MMLKDWGDTSPDSLPLVVSKELAPMFDGASPVPHKLRGLGGGTRSTRIFADADAPALSWREDTPSSRPETRKMMPPSLFEDDTEDATAPPPPVPSASSPPSLFEDDGPGALSLFDPDDDARSLFDVSAAAGDRRPSVTLFAPAGDRHEPGPAPALANETDDAVFAVPSLFGEDESESDDSAEETVADLRWLLRAERQRVSELESLLKRAGSKIQKLTKQVRTLEAGRGGGGAAASDGVGGGNDGTGRGSVGKGVLGWEGGGGGGGSLLTRTLLTLRPGGSTQVGTGATASVDEAWERLAEQEQDRTSQVRNTTLKATPECVWTNS